MSQLEIIYPIQRFFISSKNEIHDEQGDKWILESIYLRLLQLIDKLDITLISLDCVMSRVEAVRFSKTIFSDMSDGPRLYMASQCSI